MRSKRLATLERLAGMAERASRMNLARANQDLQRKLAQQGQLESYEAEYAERWLESGRDGIAGQRLVEIAAFRQSLARTIQTQSAAVRTARDSLGQEAATWRRQRERLRVFGMLTEAARKREKYETDRREQRTLDDLAAGTRRIV